MYMYFMFFPSQNGSPPLFFAALKGHSEVVKLLLQAGARDIPNEVLQIKHVYITVIVRLSLKNSKKQAIVL